MMIYKAKCTICFFKSDDSKFNAEVELSIK